MTHVKDFTNNKYLLSVSYLKKIEK